MGGTRVGRQEVLDAARELLMREGPQALSIRRIADQAGASTMPIYSQFGDKEGVLDALAAETFAVLDGELRQLPRADSDRQHLIDTVLTYRRVALEFVGHYQLLFDRVRTQPQLFDSAMPSLSTLTAAVAPFAHGREPAELAARVFAVCHGLVTLEQLDAFPPGTESSAEQRLVESALAVVGVP